MLILLRRIALAGSGLTFGSIAIAALLAPTLVAPRYAYALTDAGSYNQFRAVFTGFWSGLAVLMLASARRTDLDRAGTFAGILVGLQALARVLSIAVDGVPPAMFVGATAAELLTAALILAPVFARRFAR